MKVVTKGLKNSSESKLLKNYETSEGLQDTCKLGLHHLIHKCMNANGDNCVKNFLKFCIDNMQGELCKKAAKIGASDSIVYGLNCYLSEYSFQTIDCRSFSPECQSLH